MASSQIESNTDAKAMPFTIDCDSCHKTIVFDRAKDEGYKSWIFATLCIQYTKEGLEVLAEKIANQIHTDMNPALSNAVTCSKKCELKDFKSKNFKCKICIEFKKKIDKHYNQKLNGKPNWSVPTIQEIKDSEMNLFKLFLPYRCLSFNDTTEADCTALLSFLESTTHGFNALKKYPVYLNEVRDARNHLMHSGTMRIERGQLAKYGNSCLKLLKNIKHPSERSKERVNEKYKDVQKILDQEINLAFVEAENIAMTHHYNHAKVEIETLEKEIESSTGLSPKQIRERKSKVLKVKDDLMKRGALMEIMNIPTKETVHLTKLVEGVYQRADEKQNNASKTLEKETMLRERYHQNWVVAIVIIVACYINWNKINLDHLPIGVLLTAILAAPYLYKYIFRILQACVRGFIFYISKQKAVVFLQRYFRAKLEGKRQRHMFQSQKGAAITLQAIYRGCKYRKILQHQQSLALLIQSRVRGYLEKSKYQKLRKAAIICQRQFRQNQELKKQTRAAARIQAWMRCLIERKKFVRLRTLVTFCQRQFRAEFIGMRCRREFCAKRNASIKLQAIYRGYAARRKLALQNRAANVIQTITRMYLARQSYMRLRQADMMCQQRVRQKQRQQKKRSRGTYEERRSHFHSLLVELYKKNRSPLYFYPLKPHMTLKLDDLYVRQAMVEKSLQGPTKPQPYNASRFEDQQKKKVRRLEDVFFKDNTLCKNIYVTGEAGVGKSTFCVHLVNLWLKVQSGTHDTDSSELNTMKRFPLLFYVDLRGVKLNSYSDIASIIEQQWKLDSIDEFLENDQCLIIADGLDESVSGEPKRGIMNNSTILITTRPWKLEALRNFVEGDNIDKQVEIVSLDECSAERLAEKVLPILAEESALTSVKSSEVFISEMKVKGLEAFLKVPMLLIQMLCLWHDDISIGNSNYSIYESLVHHQIMMYIKSKNNTVTISSFDKNSPRFCKKANCPCKNFSDIISKVGKLALNALVSENRENELVFDHSTRTMHGLCEQDVETCLRIGILSQHKLFGKITEKEKYISFVHKTYQEFFASLYLSYKVPNSDIKSVLKTAICKLDRMLELEKILMFVSGLNPEMGRKMADLLLTAADQDPRIQEYRQTAERDARHDELVSNIQTAILAASTECELHQHQQQFRLDDVIVNKDNMSGVLLCLPAGSQVTSISMRGDHNNYLPTDGVMRRINTSRLQKVVLRDCTISGDSLSQVVPSSLCALRLDDVRMSHAALESLGSRLSAAVNLRRVVLRGLQCETHGGLYEEGRCAPLSLDFSSHVGLEKLYIRYCEISSFRMAPGMGKLEKVNLYLVTTTTAILKQLVDSLPGNNVKVELWKVTIRHEAGATSPAAILHDIRQSCRAEKDDVKSEDEDDSDSDDVERGENGDLFVNEFVFHK